MRARRILLAALLLFAASIHAWTSRRDLPHSPESDEVDFLVLAAQMAATGDPNPHWFGHPGATFLYPYAAGLRAAHVLAADAPWLGPDPQLPRFLERHPALSIGLGRFVSAAYAVLALWLICAVGDLAFGPPVGLIGGWLAVLSPITLEHVTLARTDGAGLFFGFLALWSLLRLLREPAIANQAIAGATLGLGIATRYFLAGILPLLLLVDLRLLAQARAAGAPERAVTRRGVLVGLAAIAVGTVVGAPFLLVELPTVVGNLAHETRASHPGADGLDTVGNLVWYLRTALPRSVPWSFLALSVVGAVQAIARRDLAPLLLLGFVVVFLGGISLATLHWGRWLIQILPIVCLFAAAGLVATVGTIAGRLRLGATAERIVLVAGVIAVTALPATAYVRWARLQQSPSTRDLARAWILRSLDPDERIAADLYTAPLQDTPFADTDYVFSLSEIADSPAALRARGYDVAMVSSAVYRRFFAEPDRHRRETAFYRTLFREATLLTEFRPGADGRGPVVRLYRLPPAPAR